MYAKQDAYSVRITCNIIKPLRHGILENKDSCCIQILFLSKLKEIDLFTCRALNDISKTFVNGVANFFTQVRLQINLYPFSNCKISRWFKKYPTVYVYA